MSIALSFMSGKGGSGKTTIALSLSDLLSTCGIKTILVDCDFSTNGASFFFEPYYNQTDASDCSFFDVLTCESSLEGLSPITINEFFHFLPSVITVGPNRHKMNSLNSYSGEFEPYINAIEQINTDYSGNLRSFMKWASSNYEVILFDCQAGYTNLLNSILSQIDVVLFVLEADSVSAAALRNLHLKIGYSIKGKKVYQIFSKATQEEKDIYSKITGTFFVNIGTLLFDWKIRQAFSRSQIPNLETVSAAYSSELCNIAKVLFAQKYIQEKIDIFYNHLEYNKNEAEICTLKNKLADAQKKLQAKKKKKLIDVLPGIIGLATIAFLMFLVYLINPQSTLTSEMDVLIPVFSVLASLGIIALMLDLRKTIISDPYRETYDATIKVIRTIEKKQERISEKLMELEKNSNT